MAISRFKTSTLAQGLPKYTEIWDQTTTKSLGSWSYVSRTADMRGFISNPSQTIGVVFTYNGTSTSTLYYSTDGTTWNSTTYPNGCLGMGWDTTNNRFIALSYVGNLFLHSTDGVTWTSGGANISSNFSSIAHGLGYNVVVDRNGFLWYGTSLTSWTQVTTYNAGSDQRVTFGNGRFIVIKNSSGGTTTYYTSTNGTSWSSATMPAAPYYVSYVNNMWFMTTGSGTTYYTSTDGASWTSRSTLPSAKIWNGIGYVNGVYWTADTGGTTSAYSLDGINWTTRAWTAQAGYGPQANASIGGVNGYAVNPDDSGEIYYAKAGF